MVLVEREGKTIEETDRKKSFSVEMTLLGNVISFCLFSVNFLKASLMAQLVKNPPAMQETPV